MSNFKLPHWAMSVFGALAVILPWAVKQESSGVFTVPNWVMPVENGIIGILLYLGFSSPSVMPTVNAKAVAMARKVGATAVLLVAGSLYFGGDTACSTLPPSVIGPTIQTVTCIISNVAIDLVVSHDTRQVTIANTITACGTDAATIETVWDAHVKAEVTEGVVPKYTLPDGGN
jgi:hypothetical protein